jgi:thiosulfate/3-mercaptopyruvate sulfurtransferase
MAYSPLLSAAGLQAVLGQVTVLDVRYRMGGPDGRAEHRRGHVPGAVFVDLDADLAGPAGRGGRHPLPDPAALSSAMRRAGVRSGRPVVVYDDWAGRAAARAWWLLRFCGHEDVRVLDGGWPAWLAAGGAIETGDGAGDGDGDGAGAGAGDFTCRPGSSPRVDVDAVLSVDVLVDARAPARYRGEHEPVDARAGHVPGAVNVPTEQNLRADGTFRSPEDLAATYAAVGAIAGADVAVYCGSGVTAAHDVLALEVAGVRAALWPGSWSEWITDPGRPVALGDEGRS